MEKSIEFLKSINLSKNDYIIVGCSGGPDSMCLLNLLYQNDYKIICAHVNHNLRKDSTKEYKFLKKYCNGKNIIFEGLELEKENDKNEAYYRKKRYDFYKTLADKYNTKYIMTAHHGDDLIETILMRITRGSNLKGYLGFPKIYDERNYKFVKPLVFYTKDQILEYNEINGIPFVNDYTNEEDRYTRNRYRHHILPFLKVENRDIHRKYLKFSEELEKASNYILKVVEKEKSDNYRDKTIDLDKFLTLDEYIMQKELESIFSELYQNDIAGLKQIHIESIINLLKKGENFTLSLPRNIKIKRDYKILYIDKTENIERYDLEFAEKVVLPNGDIIEKITESTDNSNYTLRLNSKDIKMPLRVRTRIDGDKIEIKNMKGHKKVKSIFIDEKINSDSRNTWPILVDTDDKILWIPGLRKSKFDIKKDEKCDIILEYIRKEQIDEKK